MDTSETYIKMCDCEEIQGQWELLNEARGDVAVLVNIPHQTYDVGIVQSHQSGYPMIETKGYSTGIDKHPGDSFHKTIWLPRQDQLQEMVKGTHIEKLGRVYRVVENMELFPSDSMEQLWLAFVMKEKYNKVWTGEKWEKV